MNRINHKEIFHTILSREWDKYKISHSLKDVYLTHEDFDELGFSEKDVMNMVDEGIVIKLSKDKFRSYLMDIAFRASDIRTKHGGNKYVLETDLKLVKKPILHYSYIRLGEKSKDINQFKETLNKVIGDSHLTDLFLESLYKAGINGLSKYQYDSIIQLINDDRDVVISAPTAFGKTICFVIPILAEAVKQVRNGYKKTIAILFYPRKSLGSDQMGRIIKLLYYLNKNCNLEITIGIDDGDTKDRKELKEDEQYRGIKCPVHIDETLIIKRGKVYCRSCKDYFSFIKVTKQDIEKEPPTIIISNIWAFQYKLSKPIYWKNKYLSEKIKFFVFDEIHAYRSLVAGILRYLMKIIKELVSPNSRIIISSATIPKVNEFVQDITGKRINKLLNLIYDEKIHGKDAEKYELYLLIGINPYTSWETYTHELAIFLSTVNRVRKNKNIQSLIFVDSVKNINRLYDQVRQAIKLGDPKDHFNSEIPPNDPYCYWVYNDSFKIPPKELGDSRKLEELRREIANNIGYHYSQLPDRFEVEDKIKKGEIDVVFTTSTLELGVDYDNVSIVVNAGIPYSPESIVQRVGRAGRKESTTLNSSLSIIVVRNNPLEYFYLYRGINSLTNMEEMPKIPVSYTNHFVILYSVLLYILTIFTKEGKQLKGNVDSLDIIINYLDRNENKIYDKLGISTDILPIRKDIEMLVNILKSMDEDKCRKVLSYINSLWLDRELEAVKDDVNKLIEDIEGKLDDLPRRERPHYTGRLASLRSNLLQLSKSKDLSELLYWLGEIIRSLDDIKNHIRFESKHPLFPYRSEIFELTRRLETLATNYREISVSDGYGIEKDKYSLYARACEVLSKRNKHIINLIEGIIGFKFMGNEFIDQIVYIKPENSSGPGEEEFLTTIMYRMPPFELVNIPFESKDNREITKVIGARHFWLPQTERPIEFLNWNYESKKYYKSLMSTYIAEGYTTKIRDLIIPDVIHLIDLLSLSSPLILKIKTNSERRDVLYIKYGSLHVAREKIRGKYSVHENIRNLYTLDEASDKFKIIHDATKSHLERLDKITIRKGNPWGINFRYVARCILGKCISTDPFDYTCPELVKQDCGLCDGKKFWSNHRKIFPKFYAKLNVKNISKEKSPLVISIDTCTYDELSEDIEFVYDSVYVYLPTGYGDYTLKEFKIKPLGYLARTSYISITLNPLIIDLVIDAILNTDSELLDLLKYKFYMYNQYRRLRSSIYTSLMCLKYDPSKLDSNSSEFRKFIMRSLIHTLAHLFYIFLATQKVNIDPSRMIYFIQDYNIYILENSKNDGIGIVETIRNEIRSKGSRSILNEFCKWCIDFLNNHSIRISNAEMLIKDEAIKFVQKLIEDKKIGSDIENVIRNLNDLNREISSRVPMKFLDLVTYRHIVTTRLDFPEEFTEYILTIINSQDQPHLCYDGCNECLILERGCSEPFPQIYLISKQLGLAFLNVLTKESFPIVEKGVGRIIESFMTNADKIMIKVPYIDDFGVKLLSKLAKSNKNIIVVTKARNVPRLKNLMKLGIKILSERERFHSKLYIFESDGERVCVQGSVNLMKTSFYENRENITIIWDTDTVKNIISREIGSS